MTLVIGTDEAGYGPNLGPLVVAATLWDVAGTPPEIEAILAAAAARAGDPWRLRDRASSVRGCRPC